MKKRILSVFGTRPEAIKMAPLVKEISGRADLEGLVCISGQHKEMLEQVMTCFNIHADYDLAIMKQNQTLYDITCNVIREMEKVLSAAKPDVVLVHGDTTTSYAAAVAAFYRQIPVGHVEAGLRTYNLNSPFPEEFNRQSIGLIAKYHFAPTAWAKQNLINERKNPSDVYVTGNTVIDALHMTVEKDFMHPLLDFTGNDRLILVTAHRRENLGAKMEEMFQAILRIATDFHDVKVVFPIHKNPAVREIADRIFSDCSKIKLCEPLNPFDFHNIMNRAYIVLTDSGGLQEEAPAFGVPVFVMRDTTERPEAISAGTAKLVGTEAETIYREVSRVLDDASEYQKMSLAQNPFGDGRAAVRITDILMNRL
ncbi:MAG: UDP-N-acetylglucosamine 2-epimerase (non-hydrolyzing) [Clostridiales Family XIII bacterium]|jgi:UDP-N-acetylglucosamine 2-epimerase (non-hydrolysing)|nr:UDP-N-acetylglucosamine 2-epimerase (non-hydrolyzing) [Clostridiales Family XIII bacterium]